MIQFKITIILLLFSLCSVGQNAAEKIFINATQRLITTNLEMLLTQKTTDKKGRVKEKTFTVLLAKFGNKENTKMIIKAPERAAGITIVVSKVPNKDGLIEVYTPANGKTRKMIANEKNRAMVGSDFSFSNYSFTNWQDLDISILAQNEIEGRDCTILEVKDKVKVDGGRAELAIEKTTNDILEIKTFDGKGKQMSYTKLADFKIVNGSDGKYQPRMISIENFEKNQKSELQVVKVAKLVHPKEEDFILDKKSEVTETN